MGTVPDAGNSRHDERPRREMTPGLRSRSDNGGVGSDAFVEMDPQRMLEVQLRIATGFYERPGVLLTTAERILREGDLPPSP